MQTATTETTITITYKPDSTQTWGFSGGALPGPQTNGPGVMYTVIWKLSSGSASGATLMAPEDWSPTRPSLPTKWTTKAPPEGAVAMGIMNRNQGSSNVLFGYKVAVDYDGATHTSTDPELTLRPPG